MCLFGVVFRGAVSSSPSVDGLALKCLKIACLTVNAVPRSLWAGFRLYGLRFGLSRPATEIGFWVACAGFGWPQPVVATIPSEEGVFFIGFISSRSGRCLSRRSNTLSAGGYLNLWN